MEAVKIDGDVWKLGHGLKYCSIFVSSVNLVPKPADSPAKRRIWTILGVVSLLIGIIGIPIPLLPTTPFLILAAYLFSRGSERLEHWLLNHRTLGPPIRNWRDHRTISKGAKLAAMISIALVFGLSIALNVAAWVLVLEGVVLSLVAAYLLSRPSRLTSSD